MKNNTVVLHNPYNDDIRIVKVGLSMWVVYIYIGILISALLTGLGLILDINIIIILGLGLLLIGSIVNLITMIMKKRFKFLFLNGIILSGFLAIIFSITYFTLMVLVVVDIGLIFGLADVSSLIILIIGLLIIFLFLIWQYIGNLMVTIIYFINIVKYLNDWELKGRLEEGYEFKNYEDEQKYGYVKDMEKPFLFFIKA